MSNGSPAGAVSSHVSAGAVPGRRLFIAGCIVLFLFSAVHMIPMFLDLFSEPTKSVEVEAKRAMRAVVIDMGPLQTNWARLNQLLSVSYSTLLFFVVAIDAVVLPAVIAHRRLRALAVVNAVFAALMLAIALAFRFPPPAVFALAAGVLFGMSAIRAR